jgi:hypothetical protein
MGGNNPTQASAIRDEIHRSTELRFPSLLPELTPEQYETMVKSAPTHEEPMKEMEPGAGGQHGDHSHE